MSLTTKDLDDIRKEVEKDPDVKVEWIFSEEKKKGSVIDVEIGTFMDITRPIHDHVNGLLYFIYSITSRHKNMIFANCRISIESIGDMGNFGNPLRIDWIKVKRIKHPKFYIKKTPDQLSKIVFPIQLEQTSDNLFKCKHDLNYIYPLSTHYYIVRIKPTFFHARLGCVTQFHCEGTFI